MTDKFIKTALLSGVLLAFVPGLVVAEPIGTKGTKPYVTHFIFRPVESIDISGLGTATLLEAVGTTQNMKGKSEHSNNGFRLLGENALDVRGNPSVVVFSPRTSAYGTKRTSRDL